MTVNEGLTPFQEVVKRLFDVTLAGLALLALAWLILPVWALATLDTRQNGLFRQLRVGKDGELFFVLKFRTMIGAAVTTVTRADDPRITRLGRLLRRWKLDEMPQFLNILRGEMSFVGPRPDVPGFANQLSDRDRVILRVRPGLTGPATLRFRHEEEILALQPDPERYNREVIFPEKVRLNRAYVENYSFWNDLRYMFLTIASLYRQEEGDQTRRHRIFA